ncbi:MAG TPA: hypothetical protein VK846_00515 [Candidatus Limnocylindria bacterium]|nr:hypothetical protein [Candidatus Limnocylindria bacterium]
MDISISIKVKAFAFPFSELFLIRANTRMLLAAALPEGRFRAWKKSRLVKRWRKMRFAAV